MTICAGMENWGGKEVRQKKEDLFSAAENHQGLCFRIQ